MSLDVPAGDDRTYEDLVADARKRIPALAEAWTDHNASDPGITILETLAWLTETYLYQFDRIEERHLHAYLRLVGESPRPPLPATVRLALTLPEGRSDLELPLGTAVRSDPETLEERSFSTTGPVALTGARLARVVSAYDGQYVDHTTANGVEGLHYLAFGPRAEVGSALYLGFAADRDPFATVDHLDLWVEFHEAGLVPPAPDPTETVAARYEWLWPDDAPEPPGSPGPEAHDRGHTHAYEPSVVASWEFCADYDAAWTDAGWEPFAVVDDGTTDLYHGGRVRLSLRGDDDASDRQPWPAAPGSILDDAEPYYWIRCTLTPRESPARWDVEPCSAARRDDAADRPPAHDLPPQFDAIRLNVVEAANLTLVDESTRLARTDGRGDTETTTARPAQTFAFESSPVLAADVVSRSPPAIGDGTDQDPEEPREWRLVSHFDASSPDDDHVRLRPAVGAITFGDGIRGRPPLPGRLVESRRTLVGGGVDGNVPADATWRYLLPDEAGDGDSLVDARALTDATGGTVEETAADALDRVRRALSEPTRAVTLSDYRDLALSTPGLRVGRATAMPGTDPPPEGCVGSNQVRVVVVPFSTRDRPEPSEGFLRAVQCHLRRHAVLTDRVVVEAPTYVGVGVDVEVGLTDDTVARTVTADVVAALDTFLDPLSGAGEGWPFGRSLYPSEVYEVVESVDGVDCVLDVRFTVEGPGRIDGDVVHLPETGLFYPLDHDVTVRTGSDACRGAKR